jgi:hypothetical protein
MSVVVAQIYSDIVVFNRKRQGALKGWNTALWHSSGELLFPLGDDNWCHEGWLESVLECHSQLGGYGVVGLNDLMHDGNNHISTPFFDRDFCIDHLGGVIAFPVYNYYNVDTEIMWRARRAGKLLWCPGAVCEHIHPANNKRAEDDIDRQKTNDWMVIDGKIFEQRKGSGFPDDFEPVIRR